MTKFIAWLNDGSYINVKADRMIKEDNMLYAHNGGELVAAVEIDAVIAAYLGERKEEL